METERITNNPTLIRRECGGWLAVSPACSDHRIGVTAATEAEAALLFQERDEGWRVLLSASERA